MYDDGDFKDGGAIEGVGSVMAIIALLAIVVWAGWSIFG